MQRSDGGESVISVLATATRGRIYAEARSIVLVIELARSIAELNPAKVSLVPAEDVFHIFNFSPSPGSSSWPWVRVLSNRRKWRWYAGDTGLIITTEGHKEYLALIPRLGSDNSREGQLRPPQVLASRHALETRQPTKTGSYGRFKWNGSMFSSEGLLLIDLENISVSSSSETLPTTVELALFRSTSLLETTTLKMTEDKIAQARHDNW